MKSGIVYTSVLIALSALLSTPTYGQCHKHQLHLLSGTLSTSASRQTGSGLFANTDTHTHTKWWTTPLFSVPFPSDNAVLSGQGYQETKE